MDLKIERLSVGEQIAAGSALALFACMFVGWFDFGFGSFNAWESLNYVSPVLAISIALTVGVVFLKANGKSLGDIPAGNLILTLGCLAALLVFFRLVEPVSHEVPGYEFDGSRELGLFLGFVASLGMAVGGLLTVRPETLERARTLIPDAPRAAPPHPAAPPVAPDPAPPPAPTPPVPPVPPADAAAFCESCGARLGAEDRFCSECGQPSGGR